MSYGVYEMTFHFNTIYSVSIDICKFRVSITRSIVCLHTEKQSPAWILRRGYLTQTLACTVCRQTYPVFYVIVSFFLLTFIDSFGNPLYRRYAIKYLKSHSSLTCIPMWVIMVFNNFRSFVYISKLHLFVSSPKTFSAKHLLKEDK